jgi:hypothetical protein
LNQVIKFYGRPGEQNGVKVVVGSGTISGAAGGTSTANGETTIGLQLKNIAAAVGGETSFSYKPEVAGVVAHEGRHGIDQRREGMPMSRAQEKAGEVRAFTTQAHAYQGLASESGWRIWTRSGGLDATAIERAAEQATQDWCAAGGNCP